MRKSLRKRGQSTLEYAVLIVVIIAALIAMQVYLKRGLSGRMRESSDQIGEQFSPQFTEANRTTRTYVESGEQSTDMVTTTNISNQWQDRSANELVAPANTEYWGT